MLGVAVYIPELDVGVVTNTYGFYSLSIPKGAYKITFSSVGYAPLEKSLTLDKNQALNVELVPSVSLLEEVEVLAEAKNYESRRVQMSQITLKPKTVQDLPSLLGEKDVMRLLQLMPGIQSGSEASSAVYVRGGGPDENLIILDDAILYNTSHLLGFFSVFNGDAIKSIQVYKGGFPARYGGRLSSIIDVGMKEGNKEEYHGKVGIGLLSSQAMLEGPLQKGKSSFLVSGRRTYIDLLLAGISALSGEPIPKYFFHDFNGKVNYEFSEKDKVYLSAYYGLDKAYLKASGSDGSSFKSGFGWGNLSTTLRWNHQYNEKLFANTSLIYSRYRVAYSQEGKGPGSTRRFDARFLSSIDTYSLKEDVDYFPSPRHNVKIGGVGHRHTFNPNAVDFNSPGFDYEDKHPYHVFEGAFYVEDEVKVTSKIRANVGLRSSFFSYEDTKYGAFEPRLSLSYHFPNYFSVKGSYTRMNQYIHLLSYSSVSLPTDLWVSSTEVVPPRKSHQVALGVAKDFTKSNITVTVEGYYKRANNILLYKEGAYFQAGDNTAWDTQVSTDTQGDSYGMEFFFRKNGEKLTTWLGYTLAWNINQSPTLNNGKPFHPKYDRRHDTSFVLTYKPFKQTTLSLAWVYGTGINYTLQKYSGTIVEARHTDVEYAPGDEEVPGNTRQPNVIQARKTRIFTERSNFRAEPFHRLDLGFQFHKQKKRGKSTWDISVYNAYSRKNPFSYDVVRKKGKSYLRRYAFLPIVPSISYRYEF